MSSPSTARHNHHDEHDHPHGHDHDHHGGGPLHTILHILHWHSHGEEPPTASTDPALSTDQGIRAVWIALAALGATTLIQLLIVYVSGSVALLADTVHNLGDALNSIPLLAALYLSRRARNRRYTYGYGRAEDLAGIVIVLSIVFSAAYIFWESIQKLVDPQPIEQPWWVAAAALIGFAGNEAVALLQIRTGRSIGSEALVADGLHARIDGLTSLIVLVAVAGSVAGFPIVDPIIGVIIGIAIVFIARDAARRVWYRLMDAVDPAITEQIERSASSVPGVESVRDVRAHWIGHQFETTITIRPDERVPRPDRDIVTDIRHAMRHQLPFVSQTIVDIDPDQ